MRRSLFLAGLIVLASVIGAPSDPAAQTGGNIAPVPGPYQAMPGARATPSPYSNPGNAPVLPYWMRQGQAPSPTQAGRTAPAPGNPVQQNFISGWVWSPYAPGGPGLAPVMAPGLTPGLTLGFAPQGQGRPPAYGPQPGRQSGYWPGPPRPAYGGGFPGQPGYAPGFWPNTPFAAPPWYGGPQQPQH